MECLNCPVAYKCRFFKHCPYEVDDSVDHEPVEPAEPVEYVIIEDIGEIGEDFMDF